jgi:hypothetical protein
MYSSGWRLSKPNFSDTFQFRTRNSSPLFDR